MDSLLDRPAVHSGEDVLRALEAMLAKHPEQAAWLDLHRRIIAAQTAVEEALPPLHTPITAERVRERVEARQSLFHFDELEIDWPAFQRLLHEVAAIAAPDLPAPADIPVERARAWYEGVSPNDELTGFLVGEALRPFLHRAAAAAQASRCENHDGDSGCCPTCGGPPNFATLDRNARRLFCARCDTGWRYRRIGCPFCGTEDPRKLAYYPSEDGVHRLYVCDGCGGYLKTLDRRETSRPFALAVERLLTVGMDLAAVELGNQDCASGEER